MLLLGPTTFKILQTNWHYCSPHWLFTNFQSRIFMNVFNHINFCLILETIIWLVENVMKIQNSEMRIRESMSWTEFSTTDFPENFSKLEWFLLAWLLLKTIWLMENFLKIPISKLEIRERMWWLTFKYVHTNLKISEYLFLSL